MKIGCIDSGVGGLFFAIDLIQSLSENSGIEIIHIGDTQNAPYGIKTPEELKEAFHNLIQLSIQKFDLKHIIVACNTACTVLDQEMINFYHNKGVILYDIIDKSANNLYQNGIVIDNQIHIAVSGTKRTIQSDIYQNRLQAIHDNVNSSIELKIHAFSPISWEHDIEKGLVNANIDEYIKLTLDRFKNTILDDYHKLSALGLFCTHYPILYENINKYFNYNVKLVTQGALFADTVENLNKNKRYAKNKITSYFTDGNYTPAKHFTERYKNIEIEFLD